MTSLALTNPNLIFQPFQFTTAIWQLVKWMHRQQIFKFIIRLGRFQIAQCQNILYLKWKLQKIFKFDFKIIWQLANHIVCFWEKPGPADCGVSVLPLPTINAANTLPTLPKHCQHCHCNNALLPSLPTLQPICCQCCHHCHHCHHTASNIAIANIITNFVILCLWAMCKRRVCGISKCASVSLHLFVAYFPCQQQQWG